MFSLKLKEKYTEWLIKALLGLVVLGIGFQFMISPLLRDLALSRQRTIEDQKYLKLFDDMRSLREEVSSLEASLATSEDGSLMLGKISDLANKNKLKVQTLTPRTEKTGTYVSMKIEMAGVGGFLPLINFLKSIEMLRPLVIGRDLVITRNRPGTGSGESGKNVGELNIQLLMESYLKQSHKKKKP